MKNIPSKFSLALGFLTAALAVAPSLQAAGFINGGFEDGNLGSWVQGGGLFNTPTPLLNATDYQVGGPKYNAGLIANTVVTPGLDALTENNLNRVYSGNFSARVNDSNNNFSVSTIKQTVLNYTDTHIFFAWAAVLQSAHGATEAANFTLTLHDDTTNANLYAVNYNSATNGGIFTFAASTGYFYTQWQVNDLLVTAGHDYTLTLLAADCDQGGHAGYVYLDGFGAVAPPPGIGAVPEPSTYGMIGAAALVAAVVARRRKQARA